MKKLIIMFLLLGAASTFAEEECTDFSGTFKVEAPEARYNTHSYLPYLQEYDDGFPSEMRNMTVQNDDILVIKQQGCERIDYQLNNESKSLHFPLKYAKKSHKRIKFSPNTLVYSESISFEGYEDDMEGGITFPHRDKLKMYLDKNNDIKVKLRDGGFSIGLFLVLPVIRTSHLNNFRLIRIK